MTSLNKTSGRIIAMAHTAHLAELPAVLKGEKNIMIPVSAFVVRLLHRTNKPLSENLILKSIRQEKVHCVSHNVHQHMVDMLTHGITRFYGNTGLWELTPDMVDLIADYKPKA